MTMGKLHKTWCHWCQPCAWPDTHTTIQVVTVLTNLKNNSFWIQFSYIYGLFCGDPVIYSSKLSACDLL